jgi:hypothetical protein
VNQVDPTVTQQGYSAIIAGYSGGGCGVYAHRPHSSFDNKYQIHARIESVCDYLPVIENRLKGTMYRSRWYGWQTVADQAWKIKTYPNAQYFRRTVVHVCEPGGAMIRTCGWPSAR